ncbi:UNVERIFIED_CONTAM: hypothetical protein K2H54_013448 [Gekko kuhli]
MGSSTLSSTPASYLGLLVLAVGLCNLGSMRSLHHMARHQHLQTSSAPAGASGVEWPPGLSGTAHMAEPWHLALLALMTVLFIVCSLPVIVGSMTHLVMKPSTIRVLLASGSNRYQICACSFHVSNTAMAYRFPQTPLS